MAIGMCVTGNFALTLTLDPWVVAPLMAHPSFPLPATRAKAAAVHATPETLAKARRRIAEEGLKVLGLRFHGDLLFCRATRFDSLRRELGEGFEGLELPATSAKPHPEPPHSVLTIGLVDREGEPTRAAVDRVLTFLSERLRLGELVPSPLRTGLVSANSRASLFNPGRLLSGKTGFRSKPRRVDTVSSAESSGKIAPAGIPDA